MALPALDLLADRRLCTDACRPPVGQADLFSAYPWKVISFRGSRIQALRDTGVDAGLLLTNSFSTALEFRLAGISAIGYARDARSWLLRKAVAVERERSHGRVLPPARSRRSSARSTRGSARPAITHRRARSYSMRSDLLAAHERRPEVCRALPGRGRISSRQAEGMGRFHAAECRAACRGSASGRDAGAE